MINALIVVNKPGVACLYESYISSIDELRVIGIIKNIDEVKEVYKSSSIDLIILDVIDNLKFMKELKNLKINANIILFLSFAKMKNMDRYLKLGMVNYIIKPFEYKDFKNVIENYIQNSRSIRNNFNNALARDSLAHKLSLNKRTLDIVNEFMKINNRFLTSEEIGEHLKLSIGTIGRYLRYLYSVGVIDKKAHHVNSGKTLYHYKYIAD